MPTGGLDGAIRYDVFALPGDGLPHNAVYARQNAGLGDGVLVQEYPESDAALWRRPTRSVGASA